jgi:uncharacterized protein (TIGR00297 family)
MKVDEFSVKSEYKRKAVHIGSSVFALLLRWLNFWQAALCAIAAFIFNWQILPRIGGRNLYRKDDQDRGYPLGILLYPLSVLILILLFPKRLYIAAASWAIMGWGDGMASIIGKRFGRKKIPWNAERSYAGSLGFFVFGGIGAVLFTRFVWTDFPQPFLWYIIAVPLLATLLATFVETVPSGINDNLTVPLSSGLLLWALYQIDPSMFSAKQDIFLNNLLWGTLINLVFGGAAYAAKMVRLSGFIAGFVVGTVIYAFGGYEFYLILIAFFVLGSGATKFGYARKRALGVAQEKGGARGWENAVANCSMGALFAILSFLVEDHRSVLFAAAFFGAFATAASDTVSSEIGQVLGKHPILITTLRRVPVGTEGAISLEGTFAGIVASVILCGFGVLLGVIGVPVALLCVVAAFIGTTVESYLGATLEQMKIIDNEIINFMNTLVGGVVAMGFVALILTTSH